MRNAARMNLALVAAAFLVFAGCGKQAADVLTETHTGRRVGAHDADGDWVAYVWHPAQNISTQGHLVALNTTTGQETELEEDLSGPMALSRGRLVWWNGRHCDQENKSDIILYELGPGTQTTIAHEHVFNLDLEGDQLVWEEARELGSEIALYDLSSGERKTISSSGSENMMRHRGPRIGDGVAVWETFDPKTRQTVIAVYEVSSEKLTTIDVPRGNPLLGVSGGRVVYMVKEGKLWDVHLYEVSTGSDQVVASLERFSAGPFIEGGRIAWCEHIKAEDFKGIPGQRLMDEKDIRDVFVYEIDSGRTRKIAGDLLCTGGRVAIHDGRVYLNVYRNYPPPGSTNLIVPVDLWVW